MTNGAKLAAFRGFGTVLIIIALGITYIAFGFDGGSSQILGVAMAVIMFCIGGIMLVI